MLVALRVEVPEHVDTTEDVPQQRGVRLVPEREARPAGRARAGSLQLRLKLPDVPPSIIGWAAPVGQGARRQTVADGGRAGKMGTGYYLASNASISSPKCSLGLDEEENSNRRVTRMWGM